MHLILVYTNYKTILSNLFFKFGFLIDPMKLIPQKKEKFN